MYSKKVKLRFVFIIVFLILIALTTFTVLKVLKDNVVYFKSPSEINLLPKISSLVAISGFVNVPIIKFSVDWWASLHQPSTVKILSETTIHSSMLTPLLLMTAAFALFSVLIFLMKYNIELIKIKSKGLNRL